MGKIQLLIDEFKSAKHASREKFVRREPGRDGFVFSDHAGRMATLRPIGYKCDEKVKQKKSHHQLAFSTKWDR